MRINKFFVAALVIAVVLAVLSPEVEARRKILKGRKTITRTYYSEPALPSWAIILIIAICEIIAGGVVFLILRWKILKPAESAYAGQYSVAQQSELN